VQVAAATPQSDSASVTVKYGAAQAAGDLNVVVVGWNDTTAAVTSIADTIGNAYVRAVGPTAYPGQLTQSIYYARNIVAASPGANSVTVKFNVRARYVDLRILEYSGIDTAAPLDAKAAAVGTAALTDSGPLTTTGPNELLVAANIVTGVTQGPGAGFTKRIITTPDGDIAEDQIAATAGTYRGTAPNSPGFWVMQMVAFRSTSVQPPTAPGNLVATAASSTQVDLAWAASSSSLGIAGYRVERCQGAGCTNFAQIGAPTATSFPDTSCSPNSAYRYRVRAVDAAGNLSDWSNIADATTPPDTQPPAAPANLVATAASSSQINLTWTASTDNVGVTGYLLERCQGDGCTSFTQIATPAATNHSDAGLSASATYGYRVRATDAAGNLGGYSAAAFATTAAVAQPPSPPTNLAATARNASQIDLTWTASTSSVGIANYLVERCQGSGCTNFAQISTPATTSYSDTGLLGSTTYGYRVRAKDAAGNLSDYSNGTSATTPAPASTATPTLVQHVSSSTDPEAFAETGNAYVFTLPNKVLAGNCLILGISVRWSATRTVAITDNNGNAWPSSPAVTTSDGANSISSIYVLPNANAGTTTITVTFDGGGAVRVKGFQYTISEFYNVATVSPVNGTSKSSTTAAPNLASGSFTPGNNDANGGNLIWSYFSDNVGTSPTRVTNFAAVGGFALLDADIAWDRSAGFFHASEYFVQATSAPVNPGMTAAGSIDRYNAVSVALKAASAGTAPAATGIRIVRISHQTCDVPPSTWPLQFPSSSGNLIVVTTVPVDVIDISSISDTRSNGYTKATLSAGDPALWYAAAAMPDPTLTITLHIRGTPVNATVVILEIAGAATVSPVDGAAEVPTQGDPNGANLFDTPVLTPASANGLTIAQLTLGTGPSKGLAAGSPAGAVFDFVHFTGQTDGSKMENSDGLAHLYNTDLSTEHWNWIVSNGGITTNYAALAVHFKAGP